MTQEKLQELHNGFETAYIDEAVASNLAYKPQFVSNNYKQGRKVLSSIEDELLACDQFQISVALLHLEELCRYFRPCVSWRRKGLKEKFSQQIIWISVNRKLWKSWNIQNHYRQFKYNQDCAYDKQGMEYSYNFHEKRWSCAGGYQGISCTLE